MKGWIKIHRKIQHWTWWRHPHTLQLFLYLLINANNDPTKCKGKSIKRGQLLTSRRSIASNTGLSEQQVRTALQHLASTNDIKIDANNRYTIITISKYEDYQSKKESNKKQMPKPSVEEIAAYCRQRTNCIDAGQFFDYYESTGWHIGIYPMKDWKAAIRMWERKAGKENTETPNHQQEKKYERF